MKNSTSTIDQLLEQKQIVCKADSLVWNVMDPIWQFEFFFFLWNSAQFRQINVTEGDQIKLQLLFRLKCIILSDFTAHCKNVNTYPVKKNIK